METNASINLSSSGVLCSLYHDLHTNKILSFDAYTYSYSYPHTHITLCHRITKDNLPVIWCEWSLRSFSICSAHLALGMTSFRLHISTRIIENVQINWSDTRADLYPRPCAHCNYPSPAVGSFETAVQGLHPVTLTNHAGPQNQTWRRNKALQTSGQTQQLKQSRLGRTHTHTHWVSIFYGDIP